MIAYLGVPLNYPNKQAFGDAFKELMFQFKQVIELDLALIQTLDWNEEKGAWDAHELLLEEKLRFETVERERTHTQLQDGSIGGIIIYTELITKRKALEAAAREAYELLKEKSEEINTFFDCALDFNYLFLEAVLKRNSKRTFSVLHARKGKEAIDFCMDIPSIQLVLMDIKMPIDRNLLFQLLEKHLS
jgi:CheY-like chemotaxis protein